MRALDDVTVAFPAAQFTAIMGPVRVRQVHPDALRGGPGHGHPGGGLDRRHGPVRDVGQGAHRVRRERIGFIFQSFNLIPTLTAAENIRLPLAISGPQADPEWFDFVVRTVGLASG